MVSNAKIEVAAKILRGDFLAEYERERAYKDMAIKGLICPPFWDFDL